MNAKKARIVFLIIPVLVLVLFLSSAVVYLILQGDYIAEQVRLNVVKQAETSYGIVLEIEEAALVGTSAIVFKNVTVDLQPNGPISNGIKTISTPELVVHFNVFDILRGPERVFQSLRSITFRNPHVIFRTDLVGISNVNIAESNLWVDKVDYPFAPEPAKLLPGGSGIVQSQGQNRTSAGGGEVSPISIPEKLSIKLHIVNGTSEWLANTTEGLVRVEFFENVNGTIGVNGDMPLDVNLEANALGAKGGSMRIFGLLSLFDENLSDIQIDVQNVDIHYLQRKGLNLSSYIWFAEGLINGTLNMNGGFKQGFNFRGSATLRDGIGEYTFFDGVFKNVDAEVDFSTRSVNIKTLTAELDGIPVTMSGRISNFADPYFDLFVVSETGGLKHLKPLAHGLDGEFPVQGTGELTSRIEGTIGNLKISGEGRLNHGSVFGYEASDLFVSYVFQGQNAELTSITGKAYGGGVSGKAVFDMTGDIVNYLIQLDASEMDASDLAKVLGLEEFTGPCSGVLSGGIMIRTDVTGMPIITGSATIKQGSVQEYTFDNIEFGFWTADRSTKIDYFTLKDGESRIHARGVFDREAGFDFDVTAERIEIDKLLHGLGFDALELRGITDFVGKINGASTNPGLSGALRIVDGDILGQNFDEILGEIAFDGSRFDIQNTSVFKGSMIHRVSGSVVLDGLWNMDLHVITEQAQVSDLLDLGQVALDMSGDISGAFSITGPVNNLITEGNVRIMKGQLLGQRLDEAELQFKLEGKKFFFRRFSGLLNGSRVELSGFLNDDRLDLSYNIEKFQPEISLMNFENKLQIAANVDIEGRIQGYLNDPVISGVFAGEYARINGAEFDSLKGEFLYGGNTLIFSSADLLTVSGKYAIDGSLVFSGSDIGAVDFKIKIHQVEIENLAGILGAENMNMALGALNNVSGFLSGQVELLGPVDNMAGKVVLYSPEIYYSDTMFENMFFSGTLYDDVVNISTMRLLAEGGHLDVIGSIALDGEMNFSATGFELPLRMIGRLIGLEYDLEGRINLDMTVEGTMSQPVVTCSFETGKGFIDRVEFDSFSGSVLFEDYGFYLSNVVGKHNGNVAEIVGFVPFAVGVGPAYTLGGLDVFIRMKEADMGLLTLLSDELEWCKGRMDAFVHLTGSLSSPIPNGYITVKNGEVKLESLRDPIVGINGSVVAEQGVVELYRVSGSLGEEGVFALGGKAILTGLGLEEVDLKVSGSKVKVFTNEFEGYVDGSASVKGSLDDLSLFADLRLYDGVVTLSTPETGLGFPVNPNLDVKVTVDKSMSFRGAGIDIPVFGQLHVTGKLNDVSVRGRIDANKGEVSLFGTSFMLEEGAAEFYDLVGYMPRVRLRATTRVGGATVLLHVSGRADDLQISFTSDPPMTTEEILALLSWPGAISRVLQGEVEEVIQDQIIDYVDSQIQQRIFRALSTTVQNALQLDEFTIKTQLGRIIEVEIGKNILDNVYLNYVRRVDGTDVKENLGIEITVHPNFLLTGGISGDGEIRVGFEAKFEF